MRRVFRWIAGGLALLALIVVFRTFTLASRQMPAEPASPIALDEQRLAEHIAGALRFRTISHQDPSQIDASQFLALHEYLRQSFPRVHSTLGLELVEQYSLLYTWKGSDPALAPILLMGHIDVVPVEPGTEKDWTEPPFEGRISGGYVWGRGAWDDKVSVLSILDAVEQLLSEGYRPRRTVLLAFGHDEEIGGELGAVRIAALLEKRGVRAEFLVDEGGLILEQGFMPGVAGPVALVGIAEKGYLTLELTLQAEGGHSSVPPRHTAIGSLAAALARIEEHPMPGGLKDVADRMFEYLGPEMGFGFRMLFANRWLFEPAIVWQLEQQPGSNALLRTTAAVTMFEGGVKENVLPSKASAVVNFRIRPGDSVAGVTEYVRSVVDDERIQIKPYGDKASEPSEASSLEAASWPMIQRSIRQAMPEAVVAPTLVTGATDARHYRKVAENAYRFIPVVIGPKDVSRFHGKDERIAVADYARCVRFFRQLIQNADAGQNPGATP